MKPSKFALAKKDSLFEKFLFLNSFSYEEICGKKTARTVVEELTREVSDEEY